MATDGKKPTPLDTTLELGRAEIAALLYIIQFQQEDKYHRTPSHREMLAHLNTVLPKMSHGGPAISSTVQIHRIVSKLRTKGYLAQVEPDEERTARNILVTTEGKRFAASQRTKTKTQ